VVAHLMHQFVDNFAIEEFKRALASVDDGYVDAKGGKHRRVFDADHTATDNDHAARYFRNVENLVAVDHELAVNREIARRRRSGTDGDQDVFGCDCADAVGSFDPAKEFLRAGLGPRRFGGEVVVGRHTVR